MLYIYLLKPEFEEITRIKNPNQIPALLYANNYDIILLDMNFRSGDNSGNEGFILAFGDSEK